MRCRLVPARLTHVNPLAFTMRPHDVRECQAMGRSPKAALRISLATSLQAFTALAEDGKVLAMLGVCPGSMIEGRGVPWFLGAPEVLNYGRDLLRLGQQTIAAWHEDFAVLENLVSSENDAAIRLLKRWGATVGGAPQTFRGLEFVPFRFERDSRVAGTPVPL